MCVYACVVCVCVICAYISVSMYPSICTNIHSYVRSCMLRSRTLWYVVSMFQGQTNMNEPLMCWEGGRGACRVPRECISQYLSSGGGGAQQEDL